MVTIIYVFLCLSLGNINLMQSINSLSFAIILNDLQQRCQIFQISSLLCCTVLRFRNPLRTHETHTAALILARGGSKGVKLKNISKVGDRTLLAIAIDALIGTKDFTSIWVSTDNFLIAEEATKGK